MLFLFLWDGLLVLGQVVDIDAFWYRRTDLGWIGLVSRDCSLCLLQQAFCVSGMLEAVMWVACWLAISSASS